MLEVRGLAKSWPGGAPLFDSIDLAVAPGELVAILGESGAGKSTFLNVIAGLDRADSGMVRVGFVFQSFHLLPYLTVGENVALPLLLNGVRAAERRQRATEMLSAVGLSDCADRKPGSLSGGEMQRVAVARAVVHRPSLVLADEPTGNLDEANAGNALEALRMAVKREGAAGLLVTHSSVAAAAADRVLRLAHRRLGPA